MPKNKSNALRLTVTAAERGVAMGRQRLERLSFTEREFFSAPRLQERLHAKLGSSVRDKSFRDEIDEALKNIPEPRQPI